MGTLYVYCHKPATFDEEYGFVVVVVRMVLGKFFYNGGYILKKIALYTGGSWDGCLQYLRENHGSRENTLWVVGEEGHKVYLQEAIPALSETNITTIPELLGDFVQEKKESRLLSIHGVESIVSSILSEKDMPYLQIEKYRQGYARALTEFLCTFRNSSLLSLEAAMRGFRRNVLTHKEKDLIHIYSEYEARLPEYGYDLQSAFFALEEEADQESLYSCFGLHAGVILHFFGFQHITPLEEGFIKLLLQNNLALEMSHCQDFRASEPALRIQESLKNTIHAFRTQGREYSVQSTQSPFIDLANALYHSGPVRSQGIEALKRQGLVCSQDNTRLEEVLSLARRIRKLRDEGVAWDSIRIILPRYQLYSSMLLEIFPAYDIPISLQAGISVNRFPLANLLMNMVNQALSSNPYPFRDKVFSSPYISFSARVRPEELYRFQKGQGLNVLSLQELQTLFPEGASHSLQYSYIKACKDSAYKELGTDPDMTDLQMIQACIGDGEQGREEYGRILLQMYLLSRGEKALYPWRSQMKGREFKEAFLNMCHSFKIEGNIAFSASGGDVSSVEARDRALWEEVQANLEILESTCRDTHTLMELIRVFSRLMDTACIPAGNEQGVQVYPVSQAQYRSWEYTFLCGLVDGDFPAAETFNFLQPQKEGLRLGHAYTTVDHARNTLYNICRTTDRGLFVSRPLSHSGKMLPPSPFWNEMGALGFLPDRAGENRANSTSPYSRREKLLHIGAHVDDMYPQARVYLQELKDRDPHFCQVVLGILRYDSLTSDPRYLSKFEGVFGEEEAVVSLLKEKIGELQFTPAILERYAFCPLRFFFDHILSVKEWEEYHPDTSDMGRYILSLLEQYTQQACAGGWMAGEGETFFKEKVETYYEEVFNQQEDAFENRLKKQLSGGLGEDQERAGLFKSFLETEEKGPDLLKIHAGKFSGSLKLHSDLSIELTVHRVDRLLHHPYILAYLYTTTRPPHPERSRRGLAFELPLSVRFLQEEARRRGWDERVGGGGYYMVRGPGAVKRRDYFALKRFQANRKDNVSPNTPIFSGQRSGFLPDQNFLPALKAIEAHICRLYDLMKKGIFHFSLASPQEGDCAYCSFSRLCRKDPLLQERLRFNLRDDKRYHVVKEIF